MHNAYLKKVKVAMVTTSARREIVTPTIPMICSEIASSLENWKGERVETELAKKRIKTMVSSLKVGLAAHVWRGGTEQEGKVGEVIAKTLQHLIRHITDDTPISRPLAIG